MDLAGAIRAVVATVRRGPGDLLPFYILGLAVPAIAQVLTVIGLAVLLGYLYTTGRIASFREEYAALDDPPDPETNWEAFVEWTQQLEAVFDPLISLPSILIVVLTIVIVGLTMFLLTAAVNAGQLATCFARLRGEPGVMEGIEGFRRYWLRMTGLYVLEAVLWIALTGAVLLLIGLAALVHVVLAIFVAIFAGLAWLIGAVIIRGVFVFAPVAMIVEDRSVLGSLRASIRYIRGDFVGAVGYYAIAVGVVIGFSGLSGTLTAIGAPALASLGSLLVIVPALDLLKTVLFGDYNDAVDPPSAPEIGVGTQVKRGLRRALAETRAFVRATPWHHALTVIVLGVGFWIGWILAGPLVGEVPYPSISQRFGSLFGPTAPLYFFSNNLSVAVSIAFAGVAMAIPALLLIWINGVALAMTARLEPDPTELLAFVVPHGIIEIPAIIVAGALGTYLGVGVWRTWRGPYTREWLAGALKRGFWVLVGIGILLALAAIIEGYVSPYYYRPFL